MDGIDKKILAMKAEGKRLTHKSIYDEYTIIEDSRYVFRWQTAVHSRIHIMLPREFVDLPIEIAKLRYPAENRPRHIKSSLDTTVNFAFLYGDKLSDEERIPSVARAYAAAIHKMNPGHEFLESNTHYREEKQKALLSWYEYLCPTITERIYNRHGFMIIEGRLMQVVFNCQESQADAWKPITREVMLSIYGDLDRQLQ